MPTLEIGQIFDRYRVLRFLSSGVSGESYEAEDTMLLRNVTLKLIHPHAILPDSARRQFFREMQGISGLHHPYIAPVLDYGEIDGRLYVARRFVGSGSLLSSEGRLWFRPPLSLTDAIQYAHQLAQTLHYIHTRGYVHGAITPSNVLVVGGPNLENKADHAPFLIADTGLAQFVRRFGTQPQPLLPVTAAPEQLGRRVIPASDQYALSALLYSWLAGRPPFVGSPAEIEQLKLTETITPLSNLNAQVSLIQDGMIFRALSVSPEDRYPTVLAFTNALRATLEPAAAKTTETLPELASATTLPSSEATVEQSEQPEIVVEAEPELPVTAEQEQVEAEPQIIEAEPAQVEPEVALPDLPETPEPFLMVEEEQAHVVRVIISSPYAEEPYEFVLHSEEAAIGRAGSSDILLDHDNLTSRHHAILRHEQDRYLIYDRRSANGVFVNGQKIGEDIGYELVDGDHISIGNYELIFRDTALAQDAAPQESNWKSSSSYEETHLERIS